MFEHADRADGIKPAIGDVPVVLQPNLHLATQVGIGYPGTGQFGLSSRNGNPDAEYAVVLSGVEEQ